MGHAPSLLDPTLGAEAEDDVHFWEGLRPVDALTERFRGHYDDAVLTGWHLVSYESLVTRPGPVIEDLRAVSGLAITFDPDKAWQHVEFNYLSIEPYRRAGLAIRALGEANRCDADRRTPANFIPATDQTDRAALFGLPVTLAAAVRSGHYQRRRRPP